MPRVSTGRPLRPKYFCWNNPNVPDTLKLTDRRFREFPADRFIRSSRAQKQKCRTLKGLSNCKISWQSTHYDPRYWIFKYFISITTSERKYHVTFRDFSAERFIKSKRNQRQKCRAWNKLSIGIKQVNIQTETNRHFLVETIDPENHI